MYSDASIYSRASTVKSSGRKALHLPRRVGKVALEHLVRWIRAWRGVQGKWNNTVQSTKACKSSQGLPVPLCYWREKCKAGSGCSWKAWLDGGQITGSCVCCSKWFLYYLPAHCEASSVVVERARKRIFHHYKITCQWVSNPDLLPCSAFRVGADFMVIQCEVICFLQ